jgi:hypothetical protein
MEKVEVGSNNERMFKSQPPLSDKKCQNRGMAILINALLES